MNNKTDIPTSTTEDSSVARLCPDCGGTKWLGSVRCKTCLPKKPMPTETPATELTFPTFPTALTWHKGPASGGVGTAGSREDGTSLWWDGDLLLILVETNSGRETALVSISCDEHYFSVIDANTGDAYGDWGPESWSWWAKLESVNLPPTGYHTL
jgi:hypothetical protein